MAVVISAMAPKCTPSLHGSPRLSRASSGAMPPSPSPPPPPPEKDAQDTLFTDEEFQALMSGQCEFLSFSENDLQWPSPSPSPSPSPLVSLQLQAQLLCKDDDARFQETQPLLCRDDDARFQETPPFALDDLEVEAPISDEVFCDEEIQALCAAPAQQASMQFLSRPRSDDQAGELPAEIQALFSDEEIEALYAAPAQQASMQFFSRPRSNDQTGKKRMPSSPPWPSCIADDDDEDEEAGPPLPSPPPPPTKKARTKTKIRIRCEHEPPPSRPPPPIKTARTQMKSRSSREHAAAVRATRLRHRLRRWHNAIATCILTHRFRAPELSRGRTVLRCQCRELALAADEHEPRGFGCCALHQDALPGDRAWMYSAQGHAPPLVGGPGEVLVPAVSAGSSMEMVRQYVRWRRSVSMPTRFYVQHAVEKGLAQQQPDDARNRILYLW